MRLRLRGRARDPQDGALPSTRLRWVARAGKHRRVLCTGSAYRVGKVRLPGKSGNCANVVVKLPPPPTAPLGSAWSIALEAVDRHGNVGTKSVIVEVRLMVT